MFCFCFTNNVKDSWYNCNTESSRILIKVKLINEFFVVMSCWHIFIFEQDDLWETWADGLRLKIESLRQIRTGQWGEHRRSKGGKNSWHPSKGINHLIIFLNAAYKCVFIERQALLSAVASGALNSAQDRVNNNTQTSIVQPQKHLNNNLINKNPSKGQINKPHLQKENNGVQRKPSTSSLPEKKRETIWDFFEQGNKKGTCK